MLAWRSSCGTVATEQFFSWEQLWPLTFLVRADSSYQQPPPELPWQAIAARLSLTGTSLCQPLGKFFFLIAQNLLLLIFCCEEECNSHFDILIFVSVGVSKQYCVVFMCLTVGACTLSSVMLRKLDIVQQLISHVLEQMISQALLGGSQNLQVFISIKVRCEICCCMLMNFT